MDPITLTTVATQVVAILTSLFSKVGESIATKFGEDAYEKSKHLYEVVRDRFAKKDDGGSASKALQNFVDEPQVYGNVFKEILLPLLQADPNFAETINEILHSGPIQRIEVGDDSTAEGNQMKNRAGEGSQIMRGGNRSTLKDNKMEMG